MSEEPPDLHRMMLNAQRHRRIISEREELVEVCQERQSMAIETQVLVDLWKELGDETESYWQAMTAVAAFHKIMESLQEDMKGFRPEIAAKIARAIGKTGLCMAVAIEETAKAMGELEIKQQIEAQQEE